MGARRSNPQVWPDKQVRILFSAEQLVVPIANPQLPHETFAPRIDDDDLRHFTIDDKFGERPVFGDHSIQHSTESRLNSNKRQQRRNPFLDVGLDEDKLDTPTFIRRNEN